VTWLRPELWPWLLALPVAAALVWWLERRRTRAVADTIGPRVGLLSSSGGEPRRVVPFVCGLLFALIAVLQPAWGEGSRTVEERGVDLIVCLDVSRSMLARDDRPDRLGRAQSEIDALAQRAQGDRMGLVLFAGEARLVVPLTRDRKSLAAMAALATPLSVATGGSDMGAALLTALGALAGATGEHESILLLTDGEDLEQTGLRAAKACEKRGITVHAIGLGSRLGAKIPLESEGGEAYLLDASVMEVVTAMNPAGLRRIAEATGGTFLSSQDSKHPLVELYDDEVLPMARKTFASREKKERANRYQWPLLAAFLCWILDLWLGVRQR